MSAVAARLADGRLHLQHGPIDLIVEAFGATAEVERGYAQAVERFGDILPTLVRELPMLRRPVGDAYPLLQGPVARRMPEPATAKRIQAGLHFFPPMEVDLNPYLESDAVYSNRLKVDLADQLTYLCPAPVDDAVVDELNWLAAACFRVVGALDVSRIDFRLDSHDHDKPYILEINPLPGLSPGISDIVIEAAADGIEHTELVNMILETALRRYGLIS